MHSGLSGICFYKKQLQKQQNKKLKTNETSS